MKQKFLFAFLMMILVAINVIAVYYDQVFLSKTVGILFFLPLIGYFFYQLPWKNPIFFGFFGCAVAATISSAIGGIWYFEHIALGFWLTSYVFLMREAIVNTEYEKGSKSTIIYFVVAVAVYAYLLSLHLVEIEQSISNDSRFFLYILYYLNVLFLAISALIYYLNSFSRKAVFFTCLTLSFIFADVLRDMEIFYLKDVSVEIAASILRSAGLVAAFLFYVTPEKKLRLLHLV